MTFWLEEELYAAIHRLASDERKSVRAVLEEAVWRLIASRQPRDIWYLASDPSPSP